MRCGPPHSRDATTAHSYMRAPSAVRELRRPRKSCTRCANLGPLASCTNSRRSASQQGRASLPRRHAAITSPAQYAHEGRLSAPRGRAPGTRGCALWWHCVSPPPPPPPSRAGGDTCPRERLLRRTTKVRANVLQRCLERPFRARKAPAGSPVTSRGARRFLTDAPAQVHGGRQRATRSVAC